LELNFFSECQLGSAEKVKRPKKKLQMVTHSTFILYQWKLWRMEKGSTTLKTLPSKTLLP
jgi:hypothetical protein